MFRKVLAGVAAIVAAVAVMLLIEAAWETILMDWFTSANAPLNRTAYSVIGLIEWLSGSFVGAYVGASVAGEKSMIFAVIVGGTLLAATAMLATQFTQTPTWFVVATTIGIPLFAFLGAKVAPKTRYV